MTRTKNTIAALAAVLIIGGLAISPASAAVRHEVSQIDLTDQILKMELQGDYGLEDRTCSADRDAPNEGA